MGGYKRNKQHRRNNKQELYTKRKRRNFEEKYKKAMNILYNQESKDIERFIEFAESYEQEKINRN